ncbi:CHAT domain-containing tetratricopeptide repeat protein [Kamptonema sp. PCC 6506]|uniref:CHAT domain-containing tetratricopeptide repeat protein n=2 Tax=Kamptonema TaxID=1501433 RepID=UPI0001DAC84B|nr:Tetratricopeptide repeat family [Kamptonema sp. PCC 6506]
MDDGEMSTQKEEEAYRLLIQGINLYRKSRFREALASWEQALTIYREIGYRQGEAASLGNLGIAYQSLGQFQLAIDYHQQLLVIVREIGYRQGEAASLGNLGIAYQSLGQFHNAIDYHQQNLAIAREIEYRRGEAISLRNQGLAYQSLGQFQLAIDYYQQSLAINREIGYRQEETASLGNLGNAYHSLGQYQLAIDYHQQSLAIAREIGYCQGETASLGNLGNAYHSLGQYQLAIDYHQQSLAIVKEIGDRQGETTSLGNLGNAYQSLGQFQKAIDYQQQSLAIKKEIGDRQGEANSLGNQGLAYQSLGQYQLAIDYHQHSLAIKREIGDRQGEAISLGNLGIAYKSLGQYQLAIDYHQHSLAIAREIGDREGEATSLNNLGVTLQRINQFPEAEEILRQAIITWEELRTNLRDDSDIVSIFETQRSSYRLMQEVLVAQDKLTEALEFSERGRTRAFIELLRRQTSEPEKGEKAEEITDYLTISDIQQVAQNQNATLVEYSIVTEGIYIWVIQPTGNIEFRRANLTPLESRQKSLNDLQEIILKARVSIGVDEKDSNQNRIEIETDDKRDTQSNFPLLQLLHEILIAPIADLLPRDPESPVIFIPHYALFLVPFAALQNPQGRYFIEDYTPLIAPSIEVLKHTHAQDRQRRETRQKALVVAEPTLHQNFQADPYKLRPYPFMEAAAESIATILETTAITGDKATKVAVINGMLETRIVHIFAHGLLDEYKPDEIAKGRIPGTIVLAPADGDDGALNAAEIIDKELNCEIVVLSACSTGKGTITGDGIIGLSRCFILAGVPSLIVSLWNIGAPAAKVLMTQFYQNLANGENRGAALRHAMLGTKKNDEYSSPSDWAGFTLIGETSSLKLEIITIEEIFNIMSIPENATPEEVIEGFYKALETNHPRLFAEHKDALTELYSRPGETAEELAERFKLWCKSRPKIEEAVANKICTAAARGTSSNPSDQVVRESDERLKENQERSSLPPKSPADTNPNQ